MRQLKTYLKVLGTILVLFTGVLVDSEVGPMCASKVTVDHLHLNHDFLHPSAYFITGHEFSSIAWAIFLAWVGLTCLILWGLLMAAYKFEPAFKAYVCSIFGRLRRKMELFYLSMLVGRPTRVYDEPRTVVASTITTPVHNTPTDLLEAETVRVRAQITKPTVSKGLNLALLDPHLIKCLSTTTSANSYIIQSLNLEPSVLMYNRNLKRDLATQKNDSEIFGIAPKLFSIHPAYVYTQIARRLLDPISSTQNDLALINSLNLEPTLNFSTVRALMNSPKLKPSSLPLEPNRSSKVRLNTSVESRSNTSTGSYEVHEKPIKKEVASSQQTLRYFNRPNLFPATKLLKPQSEQSESSPGRSAESNPRNSVSSKDPIAKPTVTTPHIFDYTQAHNLFTNPDLVLPPKNSLISSLNLSPITLIPKDHTKDS